MLRFRIDPLRFFGRRTKSTFDISHVMEPLQKQFDVHHLKIEPSMITAHKSVQKIANSKKTRRKVLRYDISKVRT